MYGYLLQDWLTMTSAASTKIVQNESDWLGLSSFQDIVFWIDVRGIVPPAGGISIVLETSPTKDESLFQPMNIATVSAIASPFTPLPKTILSTNPSIPLATWVRWALMPLAATPWSLTFRILASANRVAP